MTDCAVTVVHLSFGFIVVQQEVDVMVMGSFIAGRDAVVCLAQHWHVFDVAATIRDGAGNVIVTKVHLIDVVILVWLFLK